MKTIWKYPLAVVDSQVIHMPAEAKTLHVGAQEKDTACLWAEVDPREPLKARRINIYGTGHPIPDFPGRYIGTFMLMDGALVFHAYESGPT